MYKPINSIVKVWILGLLPLPYEPTQNMCIYGLHYLPYRQLIVRKCHANVFILLFDVIENLACIQVICLMNLPFSSKSEVNLSSFNMQLFQVK